MHSPRVQERWRLGGPRIGVLSGPEASDPDSARLAFEVALGDDVGRCYICRSEALGLQQLTCGWIERALTNVVLRLGAGEVRTRITSADGLEIRMDDAADDAGQQ
ncbi:MAG: hypothetical protein JWM73_2386 [Solirubrobacterales bacterium]|nr:hypothetical protein [Solirubrobacterales bacterium]